MQQRPLYRRKWDLISVGASLACAVHCILLPIFFTTLPLFGLEIIENHFLELVTILVSLLIGGGAIWTGYKNYHRKKYVLFFFLAGIILMVSGNFFHGAIWEIPAKFGGAILLIVAHIKNWRLSGACSTNHLPNPKQAYK